MFLPQEDQKLVAETLASDDKLLNVYLFGSNQAHDKRGVMLAALIKSLSKAPQIPVDPHSRPILLEGHPFRVMTLDEAIQISQQQQQDGHSLSIRELRDILESQMHLNPILVAPFRQRLGESLLRRFWNLLHEDDLHEAIWVLSDVLNAPSSLHYQRLETYLTLGTALFFRYQMLHREEDLNSLLLVLEQQKNLIESPSLSMTIKEIHEQSRLLQGLTPQEVVAVGFSSTDTSVSKSESPENQAGGSGVMWQEIDVSTFVRGYYLAYQM